ncbi:phosphate ABC transporter substrate-binding protein [Anaeromassilibacillus senegalensis]|uniref:Phosphate-binding protein n=1 Tax=Anaeromassilibacillus senegalensis TaxID=1673717 RepID=A0ABS9CP35_9FIRM|nr:phosphate ABC transporter substrate-binding protein [Anaeromassilibacillus senegalensis]MCF2652141.1 phosphate ABC transporter substrate-binding protein [Anaeromassilibacillus senegalensis]
MKAKKILAIAAAALLTMTAFTACGNSETASTSSESSASESSVSESPASESSEESSETVSQLGGSVSTDGSTSMEKLMGIYQEVYTELSGTTINYNPTGSGSGITAVTEGRCDIGLASRNLKDEEAAAGLTGHIVAIDGIAIVVNPESKVADLTVEQIKQLYTGEITDWSEVGGDAGEVVVIGRESGSGTRDGFESVVGAADTCKYNQELTSTGAVIAAVASNPNAIGYASLSAVDDTVKALTVNGVECSEETIQSGDYAVQRNFVMVTNDNTELSPEAQAFVDWALSADADEYVREAGCVPVKH